MATAFGLQVCSLSHFCVCSPIEVRLACQHGQVISDDDSCSVLQQLCRGGPKSCPDLSFVLWCHTVLAVLLSVVTLGLLDLFAVGPEAIFVVLFGNPETSDGFCISASPYSIFSHIGAACLRSSASGCYLQVREGFHPSTLAPLVPHLGLTPVRACMSRVFEVRTWDAEFLYDRKEDRVSQFC